MLDAQQWVVEVLKSRTLPDDVSLFLDLIRNPELGTFEIQENTYWDYKDSFPHSMTDDYFIGICRLVCGFHNRYGGLIIFGIHDKIARLDTTRLSSTWSVLTLAYARY